MLKNKGISRKNLNEIIIEFDGISDDTLHKVQDRIKFMYKQDFFTCYKVRTALPNIIERINEDLNLKNKEVLIVNYLKSSLLLQIGIVIVKFIF